MRAALAAGLVLALLGSCDGDVPIRADATHPASPRTTPTPDEPTPTPSPASPSSTPDRATRFEQVVLAENVGIPIGLTIAPDGRLFFAQVKEGLIRVIDPATGLVPEPVARFEVATGGEFGLVGFALDPAFATNHRMYANYTVPGADGVATGNRVVRLVERDGIATVDATLIDDIPPAEDKHVAGRLAFGPDGMLYVAVGDTQRPDEAQDPASTVGKILRITTDGEVPADNPFPGSRTFALGFRNPFGLAFDPADGALYAVDNGPASHDEVNHVVAGGNYGHPTVFGPGGGDDIEQPLWHSRDDSHGMSGITVVRDSPLARFDDRLLFCTVDDGVLHSLRLPADGVGRDQPVEGVHCTFDVTTGPGGSIYVASEKIVRLDPVGP